MKLEQRGISLDLVGIFKKELRGMPKCIALQGNPMQVEIATRLLAKHRPHLQLADDGEPIQLMSLDQYASRFLSFFLAGTEPLRCRFLLHGIPEQMLIAYAEQQNIPVVQEEKDDVRKMLDNIAEKQPQTYFSLARSAERLAGNLPKKK